MDAFKSWNNTAKFLILAKKGANLKKILLIICLMCACFAENPQREIIVVSLPMQKEFVEKIAGGAFEVVSLVESGVNPHDFEPKVSMIKKVNSAIAYFAIGIEFEDIWLKKFKAQNPKMQIFNTQDGILKIDFTHKEHNHHDHDEHEHSDGDTHIWLSAKNAKMIAKNIFEGLQAIKQDSNFRENYEKLEADIVSIDKELKNILSVLPKGQKFVVFHPMLGYFARDYDLEEIAIEVEGKSPKMQEMIKVIKEIKHDNLKVIFAQPEFSTKAAEFIVKESRARLGYFSPLKTPWGENLIEFAKELVRLQK